MKIISDLKGVIINNLSKELSPNLRIATIELLESIEGDMEEGYTPSSQTEDVYEKFRLALLGKNTGGSKKEDDSDPDDLDFAKIGR